MDNFKNNSEKILYDLIAILNYSFSETARKMNLTKRQVQYKYHNITRRILHNFKKKGIASIEDLL